MYEKTADMYDYRHQSPTTKLMRKKEKAFLKHISGLVLDVGCGTGYHLSFFPEIIGIDISKSMLKHAKKRKKPLVICSGEKLAFKDKTFDGIVCFSVLNFCNAEKTVKEISRVIKDNGMVLVSVASVYDKNYSYKEKKSLKIDKYHKVKKFYVCREKARMKLFTKKDFVELFEKNGFMLKEFDSLFVRVKPKWNSFVGFSFIEKLLLALERVFDKKYGCVYFGLFEKAPGSQ